MRYRETKMFELVALKVAGRLLDEPADFPRKSMSLEMPLLDLNCSDMGATALSLYGWNTASSRVRNAKRINLV
jgi:hypothetical protein